MHPSLKNDLSLRYIVIAAAMGSLIGEVLIFTGLLSVLFVPIVTFLGRTKAGAADRQAK
jgi:hypothetical protein